MPLGRIFLVYLFRFGRTLSRGAHEQQIWQVISRKILNLSLNAKICISKNMALF